MELVYNGACKKQGGQPLNDFSALQIAHKAISEHVKPGDFCIDATAGRGRDTAFLCSLVGESGKVLAFDIQPEAVESTKLLLDEKGFSGMSQVVLDSHDNMERYAENGTVSCITFNFGWLPAGRHDVFTRAETSIPAIEQGLRLLKLGGLMSLCIYYGRDCGFDERDAILEHLEALDSRRYTVLVCRFANRPNNPPIPVFIWKE